MFFIVFGWGSAAYNKQALLAAKSILARCGSAKIIVFASRPEYFVDRRILVFPITRFDLKKWRGPLGYIHRPKIHILKKSILNIDDNEPICYLDSDMYCYGIPEELNASRNNIIMFRCDGRVGTSFHPRLHNFLASNEILLKRNNYAELKPDFRMYNSGLIYLPSASWRMKALENVLDLTDLLCTHFPRQMNWLEQVSFSHILPRFSEIDTISGGFEHYWDYNSEMALLLEKMTIGQIEKIAESKNNFDELYAEAESIQKTAKNRLKLRIKKSKKSIIKRITLLKAKYYNR